MFFDLYIVSRKLSFLPAVVTRRPGDHTHQLLLHCFCAGSLPFSSTMDSFVATKTRDPFIFQTADDFFRDIDGLTTDVKRPATVSYQDADQLMPDGKENPVCSHGAVFRFNDGSLLLIQFMRPRV